MSNLSKNGRLDDWKDGRIDTLSSILPSQQPSIFAIVTRRSQENLYGDFADTMLTALGEDFLPGSVLQYDFDNGLQTTRLASFLVIQNSGSVRMRYCRLPAIREDQPSLMGRLPVLPPTELRFGVVTLVRQISTVPFLLSTTALASSQETPGWRITRISSIKPQQSQNQPHLPCSALVSLVLLATSGDGRSSCQSNDEFTTCIWAMFFLGKLVRASPFLLQLIRRIK